MGNNVLNEIISRIKLSKYFSISLDLTPDEGHIDQLRLVFRYIKKDTPVERFLVFMPNQGHKTQDMYDGLINFLNKYDLNIKNCRGQSYDNASAMSGKYNGLQSKILKNNKLASWIPCATHSLNLVGKAAAECCTAAVEFFDFLEQLYVFFTASTKRYELLVKALSLEKTKTRIHVPQRVNTTRWSCRSDATKALILGYKQFKSTLIQTADDFEQTTKTRCDANYRNTATSAIKSLKNFVQAKRDNFDQYEKQGAEILETTDYLKHRKRQKNIRLNPIDFYETPEVDLTSSQKFKIQNFLPVIDKFISNLDKRLSAYELVYQRFGFLRKIEQLSNREIENEAIKLVKIYQDDIDEHLGNELIQFKEFYKHFKGESSEFHNISQEHLMYKILINKEVKECFPNVEIVLRIYLVIMITNSSSERSFSNLKHIKIDCVLLWTETGSIN
ncbi:zinc finger MYM-type protein 1-like [Hydra vulgaris]|uniref:Zinc finger MYM-type protein 1-like n=1 Tax=Hydra vulgaris TaxID=6087 RepID=A0ABM4BUA5_HYDVU